MSGGCRKLLASRGEGSQQLRTSAGYGQFASIHPAYRAEDGLGVLFLEFTKMGRGDAPLLVGENGKRKTDCFNAEGVDGSQPILFANQQRVVDLHAIRVL